VKILVVSAGIVSDRRPHGEALIAFNILSRLARRGHEVTAYVTEYDDEIPGVTFKTISAHAPGAALSRLAFARRAARAARSEQADVHHLLLPLTTDEGYTTASGAPLVVGPLMLPWPAGDGGAKPRNRLISGVARLTLPRYEQHLHARTMRRASSLMVTCRPALAAIDHDLRGRCVEVPYGVDTTRFTPSPLPGDPVVLFYSVLLPRKGYRTLLRAFPMVRERIPRARLIMAGDDPRGLAGQILEEAERLGIADAVTLRGPVKPADAPMLFREARVFCQPSFGEPFGMTILEAMASGRPVVATAAGGVPGFVRDGEHGRLVQPGDERLLADALTSTLVRREAERIGAHNREVAVARYDWERVVDRIEAAYAAAAAGKESPRVRMAG